MGNHLHVRHGAAIGPDFLRCEAFMHFARAGIGQNFNVGLSCDITGQILIGNQQHPINAEAFNHLHGVGRCAADIAFGLHIGRGVHIGDNRHAGDRCLAARGHQRP